MDDQEIAEEIQRRGLEFAYLRELAASLGYGVDEGWDEQVLNAIDAATMEQRRRAALRTLRLSDGAE